jgi:hypothetical protein
MGDLVQFVPRPNPKADRAFWIGKPEQQLDAIMSIPLSYDKPADTAPSEYVAPDGDCA